MVFYTSCMKLKSIIIAVAVIAFQILSASAANIIWNLSSLSSSGDSIVYNPGSGGSTVWAYDYGLDSSGSVSLNGVTFTKTNQAVNTGISLSNTGGTNAGFGDVYYDNTAPVGVTSGLVDLYDDAYYAYSTSATGTTSLNLSLSGLTVGQKYVVQIFTGDYRVGSAGRLQTVTGGANTTSSFSQYDANGYQPYVLGEFTADSASQQIDINGLGVQYSSVPMINAVSLSAIPEPSTYFMILGLSLFFIVAFRRKISV